MAIEEGNEPDDSNDENSTGEAEESTPPGPPVAVEWVTKFNLLKEYKDEHDTTTVPQKEPILGSWVNKQRMEKKKFDEGTKTSLTKERCELLESIGFQWAKPKGQESWERRFKELSEYKAKFGNCIVPTKWPKNKGEFVMPLLRLMLI